MSVDKLVDSTQLDADLTSVANAIRTKGGTSAQLAFPADFVSAIAAIPSGGVAPGKIIKYIELIPASNLTSSNQATVNLIANKKCIVIIAARVMPTVQNSFYQPIIWSKFTENYATGGGASGYGYWLVLRPSGSSGVGTDHSMCVYTKSTGVLLVGGQYGTFEAGKIYDIYQIEME